MVGGINKCPMYRAYRGAGRTGIDLVYLGLRLASLLL